MEFDMVNRFSMEVIANLDELESFFNNITDQSSTSSNLSNHNDEYNSFYPSNHGPISSDPKYYQTHQSNFTDSNLHHHHHGSIHHDGSFFFPTHSDPISIAEHYAPSPTTTSTSTAFSESGFSPNAYISNPSPDRQKSSPESTSPSPFDTASVNEKFGIESSNDLDTAGWFDDGVSSTTKHAAAGSTNCHVCGEPAGKHSAYGGKVCPSCRAFFRRSVQTKYYAIFACNKGERCVINASTRKSCKYCRFKKCLQARMQISWVLSEQERDRRFNKLKKVSFRNNLTPGSNKASAAGSLAATTFQKQPLPSSPTSKAVAPVLSMSRTPEIQFTVEEQLRIENWMSYIGAASKRKYSYFFSCEQECLRHLASIAYFGGKADYELWRKFTDTGDQFAQEILMNLDTMKELPIADREALIRANCLVSYSYTEAVCIDEVDSGLCKSIKAAIFSGQYPLTQDVVDMLAQMRLWDKNPVIKYDQIYVSPWAASYEDEQRHRVLIRRMKSWAQPGLNPNASHDPNMTSLMRLIIAFSPDLGGELQQRETCERILHQYCMLLYRYAKKAFGIHGYAKFAEAMSICADAREAADILHRRLPI